MNNRLGYAIGNNAWETGSLKEGFNWFLPSSTIQENFQNNQPPNYNIYCFWTGTNKMSDVRKQSVEQLKQTTGCNVILVTPKTLDKYILKSEPLHPGYQYLSATHRADYIRTYFMRFHGGGYADIKKTTGSWRESFKKLYNSDKWAIGYKEIKGGVAYKPLADKWSELIGNCAYICKPNTPFVIEWYNEMKQFVDKKYNELKKYPAQHPQDAKDRPGGIWGNKNKTNYPIEWNEMLGRIFHKIAYKYKAELLNTLPVPIFVTYK